MTRRPTARLAAHVLLAVAGVVGAVLIRAPALLVLVAPSLAMLAVDLVWRPGPPPRIAMSLVPPRVVEGDTATVVLRLDTSERLAVGVTVDVPAQVSTADPPWWDLDLLPGAARELAFTVVARRWGGATIGPVRVRQTAPCRLLRVQAVADLHAPLRILPPPASMTQLVRPARTHASAGNRASRHRADGAEFAELRPYQPGDRLRDVNWRTTVRRNAPWVNARHPDRQTDVVLLVDAYDPEVLDEVLRGALTLAEGYLADRDRVGVTSLGGAMRWLRPGSGGAHRLSVVEALLDTQVLESYAAPNVAALSARTIPPGALTVVVTPATDPRMTDVAVGLRARGRDVAVVVVEPRPAPAEDVADGLAHRLVALQRRAARDRLHLHGLAAVGWDPHEPVDQALAELRRWRRRQPAGWR